MTPEVSALDSLGHVLSQTGLTLDEIRQLVGLRSASPSPTLAQFYEETLVPLARSPRSGEARGGGTFRTFEPYWRLLVEGYPYATRRARASSRIVHESEKLYAGCGSKLVQELSRADVAEAVRWSVTRASLDHHWRTIRREKVGRHVHHSNQQGARRNAVGAYRYLVSAAHTERLLPAGYDPCAGIYKPPKTHGRRRAFTEAEYVELWTVIVTGGDDPELDGFLVETVAVTGARREGLLNLRLRSLDPVRGTIWLNEKGDRLEEQPATVDLIERLTQFARSRGASQPSDPVFCYLDSKPGGIHGLTSRRFDTLHQRIQRDVPWADSLGVTLHWWRHHAITQVERIAGEAVAARFARHRPRTVTHEYSTASMAEVCRAVEAMTESVHPLAPR